MTSKGRTRAPKWSLEAAKKAALKREYIKIGPSHGKLMLRGAVARWKKSLHKNDVYVPSLRVSGSVEDITNFFIALKKDVSANLNLAYNSSNYNTTQKAAFDAEMLDYEAYSKQLKLDKASKKLREGPGIALKDLQYYVDNLKNATVVKKVSSVSSPKSSKNSLLARVKAAKADGKFMDVSKLDSDGKGAVKISANSKRYGVKGLAVVSTNKRHFKMAMKQLGPEYEKYGDRWTGKTGVRSSKVTKKKSKPRKRVSSPLEESSSIIMPDVNALDSVDQLPTSPLEMLGSPFME